MWRLGGSSKTLLVLLLACLAASSDGALRRRPKQQPAKAKLLKVPTLSQGVHNLFVTLHREPRPELAEPFSEFLPKCMAQAKNVTAINDMAYTDTMLRTNLEIECDLERQFPTVSEDGFASHEACVDFADKLHKARMQEIRTRSEDGYEKFCAAYHLHLYPDKEPPKPVKKKSAAFARALPSGSAAAACLVAVGLSRFLQ